MLQTSSLALLTDLYQLTMAYGYWVNGKADQDAVFHLSFRELPFGSGYAVACGLQSATDLIDRLSFAECDLAYLATLETTSGHRLFPQEFLAELKALHLRCDIDAVDEGTVIFPREPLLRVRGPLLHCQLLETLLLNIINFQTLIATKAARVVQAARGEPVLEFGLRRAHGIDGALSASRAAYVGGCAATSNVLAGKTYGIPVKGTHAHSWVMSFASELEAFRAYARAMPDNCVFLVDTYDSLQGVRHAIEMGKELRQRGHTLGGIRLDSGDLAWLSIEARKMLDEAGFETATIVASSDLDERLIASLKQQGATIAVWGVGTRLATAYDQPALGGVYKLSAIRAESGSWQPKLKLSEQAIKISVPGVLQIRRFVKDGEFRGDMIFDESTKPTEQMIIDPTDDTRTKTFEDHDYTELLRPVYRQGKRVASPILLADIRQHTRDQLAQFHDSIKRFENPHEYPVGLEPKLHALRYRLIAEARGAVRKADHAGAAAR